MTTPSTRQYNHDFHTPCGGCRRILLLLLLGNISILVATTYFRALTAVTLCQTYRVGQKYPPADTQQFAHLYPQQRPNPTQEAAKATFTTTDIIRLEQQHQQPPLVSNEHEDMDDSSFLQQEQKQQQKQSQYQDMEINQGDSSPPSNAWLSSSPFLLQQSQTAALNSATGSTFSGQKIRTYQGPILFANRTTDAPQAAYNSKRKKMTSTPVVCEQWAVVTTIYEPSLAVQQVASLPDWSLVIVADRKTPRDYYHQLQQQLQSRRQQANTEANIHFLSVEWQEQQQQSSSPSAFVSFLQAIPYRHFARKNIGYLYAIQQGAKILFDFDDDNILYNRSITTRDNKNSQYNKNQDSEITTEEVISPFSDSNQLFAFNNTARVVALGVQTRDESQESFSVFNHHPLMGASTTASSSTPLGSSWPRGFPLEYIQDTTTHGFVVHNTILEAPQQTQNLSVTTSLSSNDVGIVQLCANENPDVDAIHRLTKPLPIYFTGTTPSTEAQKQDDHDIGHTHQHTPSNQQNENPQKQLLPILAPSDVFVPYNAQATIHLYSSFFALLLPFTVSGRVSDIWRAYFTETFFPCLELQVVMAPPTVYQIRNPHSYLGDFQAEWDIYVKTASLLSVLNAWRRRNNNNTCFSSSSFVLVREMEALWIELYERGFIESPDVQLLQLWIQALDEIGYQFPPSSTTTMTNNDDSQHDKRHSPGTIQHNNDHKIDDPMQQNGIIQNDNKRNPGNPDNDSSSHNHKNQPYHYFPSRRRTWSYKNIWLVGQFDGHDTTLPYIIYWVQQWRQVFPNVAVWGPFRNHSTVADLERHGIPVYDTTTNPGNLPKEEHHDHDPYRGIIMANRTVRELQRLTRTAQNNDPINNKDNKHIDGIIFLNPHALVNMSSLTSSVLGNLSNGEISEQTVLLTSSSSRSSTTFHGLVGCPTESTSRLRGGDFADHPTRRSNKDNTSNSSEATTAKEIVFLFLSTSTVQRAVESWRRQAGFPNHVETNHKQTKDLSSQASTIHCDSMTWMIYLYGLAFRSERTQTIRLCQGSASSFSDDVHHKNTESDRSETTGLQEWFQDCSLLPDAKNHSPYDIFLLPWKFSRNSLVWSQLFDTWVLQK